MVCCDTPCLLSLSALLFPLFLSICSGWWCAALLSLFLCSVVRRFLWWWLSRFFNYCSLSCLSTRSICWFPFVWCGRRGWWPCRDSFLLVVYIARCYQALYQDSGGDCRFGGKRLSVLEKVVVGKKILGRGCSVSENRSGKGYGSPLLLLLKHRYRSIVPSVRYGTITTVSLKVLFPSSVSAQAFASSSISVMM